MVVFIDSGTSHNYMNWRITEELKLPITITLTYPVSLGDGHRRMTRGRCEKVRGSLEEATVEEEFYVFELGGVDVILGVAWLAKLGEVMINWGETTMVYYLEGKRIRIRGDPTLSRQLVEPKSLLKLTDAESWALVRDLGLVEKQVGGEWPDDLTREQKAELGVVL